MKLRERMRASSARRACARGAHAWDGDLSDIGEGSLFHKIACTREGCGYAMDGVHFKAMLERLPGMRKHLLAITGLTLGDDR